MCPLNVLYKKRMQIWGNVYRTDNHSILNNHLLLIWCDFDRASSLICGNKMPTRCNRGFYCRPYCLLNMFRAPICPSSGTQEYYTVVATCGISCCKNVKNNFVSFCGICVLSLKCHVLFRFVTRYVECRGGRVWVFLVASDKICNKHLCCI
jgi:hypothetical protein